MATRTLYVTDLDGTLLGADSRVSAVSASLLTQLAGRGALVTAATARTPATVQPLLAQVAPSHWTDGNGCRHELPTIVMTGAGRWKRVAERFASLSLIPQGDAEEIARVFDRSSLRPFVYCLGHDGAMLQVYHSLEMTRREDLFYQQRRCLRFKHFHLGQKPQQWGRVALFFATGPVDVVQRACEALREAATGCAVAWYPDILSADTGLIDIYAPGVSKARALREMAAEVGADRTVVFGDNLNDLPMMREATLSVAVENALPQVRQQADVVIGPNTADAVPRFIASDIEEQGTL